MRDSQCKMADFAWLILLLSLIEILTILLSYNCFRTLLQQRIFFWILLQKIRTHCVKPLLKKLRNAFIEFWKILPCALHCIALHCIAMQSDLIVICNVQYNDSRSGFYVALSVYSHSRNMDSICVQFQIFSH